jgi:hypothetical protein
MIPSREELIFGLVVTKSGAERVEFLNQESYMQKKTFSEVSINTKQYQITVSDLI